MIKNLAKTLLSSVIGGGGTLVLYLASGYSAEGAVIIGNLAGSNDNGGRTGSPIATSGFSKAAGFTMPSGNPYSLDSIDLRLQINNNTSSLTDFALFADVSGNPGGSPLVNFDFNAFNSNLSIITNGTIDTFNFTPTSPFTLNPNTTYWFAVRGTSSNPSQLNAILWLRSSTNITPTGIATSAGYRFNNSGVFPPKGSSSNLNTYQLNATDNATEIPEGSNVIALILFGGVLVMGLKSR